MVLIRSAAGTLRGGDREPSASLGDRGSAYRSLHDSHPETVLTVNLGPAPFRAYRQSVYFDLRAAGRSPAN